MKDISYKIYHTVKDSERLSLATSFVSHSIVELVSTSIFWTIRISVYDSVWSSIWKELRNESN